MHKTLTASLCALAMSIAAALAAEPARLTPQEVSESVLKDMDRGADACQDFYRYACGGWMDRATIPPDQPEWDRGFSDLFERNRAVLRDLLEEAMKNPKASADAARCGTFYATCMDEAAIEKAGVAPLKPWLGEITKVTDAASVLPLAGKLQMINVNAPVGIDVDADFKNPEMAIAHLGQAGLGLPDRDYYLKDDEKSVALRKEYQGHVSRILALVGEPKEKAEAHAQAIVAFETDLAKVSLPKEDTRDPDKIYHKIDLAGLKKLTPELPWEAYFSAAGYPNLTQINVTAPGFIEGFGAAAKKATPDTLQAWLRWHLAHATAAQLTKPLQDENFAFYGKRLQGQDEIPARWKRCVSYTDATMGESLGKLYVDKAFPGESKAIALEMIRGIESSFQANLPNLEWMDDATRARAVEKVKAVNNKIGYPDRWRDYSALQIKAGDHFGNVMAGRRYEAKRQLAKVGGPVDRGEWAMTPPTVNAYYNPLFNEMVFPAGIMQRPFFNRDFPAPMNYGGIGMGMGHELTHGFDDQGRKFDPKGRLQEWWAPEVGKRFEERAKCVEDLYSSYEVEPGLKINGKLTLGENIADLGGIKEAYHAWRAWSKAHGDPKPYVEPLTNDQLFFVGYAQAWCTKAKPEFERLMVNTNPHSLPRFRIIGPLSNLPEFSTVFQCKPGAAMNPEKKCEVW